MEQDIPAHRRPAVVPQPCTSTEVPPDPAPAAGARHEDKTQRARGSAAPAEQKEG